MSCVWEEGKFSRKKAFWAGRTADAKARRRGYEVNAGVSTGVGEV